MTSGAQADTTYVLVVYKVLCWVVVCSTGTLGLGVITGPPGWVAGTEGTSVSVTGQMVVDTATVTVVTDPTGQFVTVGAQLRIVETCVVYTVEVVYPCGLVVGTGVVADGDSVTGQTVVDTGTITVVTDPYGQFVTVGAQL